MTNEILNKIILGNSVLNYIYFISNLTVYLVIIQIFKKVILKRIGVLVEKTSNKIDDYFVETLTKELGPLLYLAVFYISLHLLTLHVMLQKTVEILSIVLVTIFGVRFFISIVIYLIQSHWSRNQENEEQKKALSGLITVIKLVIWSIAVILLFDNLGIEITSLIAGLGIGGIAIALAAQAVLGDLFSYFTIFFDKPFQIGDFIIVDEHLGAIEYIGIKTTRIRSLSGEQLIFSNTDLTNSRVRNYKRMEKRRVVFKIGVIYQTSLEHVKEIPVIMKDIIENTDETVFDRSHFFSFADFSLVYETVYYVIGNDYNKYMDIQQHINVRLREEFDRRGIEFAYPTQQLYLSNISHDQ